MSSSGTLPPATADEVLAGLLVERRLLDAAMVRDARDSLGDGEGLILALLSVGAISREVAELVVADLERGVLTCPGCPGRFNVGSLPAGARFRCKTCGTALTVPAIRVTAAVLDGTVGGMAGADADIDVPAPSRPVVRRAAEVDLELHKAGGMSDGEVLHFDEDEADAGARPKRAPAGPRPSRRSAGAGGGAEKPPDPHWWKRFVLLVVAPVVLCVVGILATPYIKGGHRAPPDEESVDFGPPSTGPTTPPAPVPGAPVPPDQSAAWKTACGNGERALSLVTEARGLASQGKKADAVTKFDEADGLFRAALNTFEELDGGRGATGEMSAKAKAWGDAQLEASQERRAAQE